MKTAPIEDGGNDPTARLGATGKGARAAGRAALAAQARRATASRRREHAPSRTSIRAERTVPANRRAETAGRGRCCCSRRVFGFGFTAVYVALDGNTQLLGIAIGRRAGLLAAARDRRRQARRAAGDRRRGARSAARRGADRDRRRDDRGGRGGDLPPGAADRRRRASPGAALVTAAATPLASLGPTLTPTAPNAVARGASGWSTIRDVRTGPTTSRSARSTPRCPSTATRRRSAPGLLVVRLPADVHSTCPPARRAWAPAGILAYSKICPHAGCAISLYRYPTYRADQPAARRSPARATTRRSCPGEGGRVTVRPGRAARCRSCR